MARPRKPKELQTGHLTVIDGQMKKAAEDAVKTEKNQLKTPPKWLINDVAKKEWRRIVKELDKIGEEIGVIIKCQREDIFDMMHRI